MVVLWIVVIAGLMLLGTNRSAQVMRSVAGGEVEAVQARWLARAGVEQAIAVLQDDGRQHDSQIDFWYDDELSFRDVELSDGFSFDVLAPSEEGRLPNLPRFGLVDAASRVNLNDAKEEQLALLDVLQARQVSALLDWRDGDEEARPGGAERRYYQRLKFGYEIRNGPLRTVHEARLVRGIDDAMFFGEDVNANGVLDANENGGDKRFPPDAADGMLEMGLAGLSTVWSYERNLTGDGGERVHLHKANAELLRERFQFTPPLAQAVVQWGQQRPDSLFKILEVRPSQQGSGAPPGGDGEQELVSEITIEWLAKHWDDLTLSDDERLPGKINVNTASRAVLRTLPGTDDAAVSAILSSRASGTGPFWSVGELYTSGVLSEEQFKEVAPHVTVRSNVFEIVSRGRTAAGISHTIVAVIDRAASPAAALYWYEQE